MMHRSIRSAGWLWGLVLLMSCQPETTPPPKREPAAVSQEKLEKSEHALVDTSRPTPAEPDKEEQPERKLRLLVWTGPMKAEQAGSFPLLLMAHGVNGSPNKFEFFASTLATQGIAVAALEFPLTGEKEGRKAGVGLGDLKGQTGDVRFVLDWLLKQVKDPSSRLYKRFDPQRAIGLGHSFGGATWLGLTRYACCLEKRIKGVILVAPSTQLNALTFKSPKPNSEGPPTLLIHGQRDETLEYSGSLKLYDDFAAPRFFLGLPKAQHSDLIESLTEPAQSAPLWATLQAVQAFVRAHTGGELQTFLDVLKTQSSEGREVKTDPK